MRAIILRAKCDECFEEKECIYVRELERWVCWDCLDVLLDILETYSR